MGAGGEGRERERVRGERSGSLKCLGRTGERILESLAPAGEEEGELGRV